MDKYDLRQFVRGGAAGGPGFTGNTDTAGTPGAHSLRRATPSGPAVGSE